MYYGNTAPAPWEVRKIDSNTTIIKSRTFPASICSFDHPQDTLPTGNINLILAAPDMLEVLREIRAIAGDQQGVSEEGSAESIIFNLARKIIMEAETGVRRD